MKCVAWFAVLVAACDAGGGGGGTACVSTADCPGDRRCVDGVCVEAPDGGARDGGGADAGPGRDGDTCPPDRSCSGGSICCADGEECVDGFQCLPACAGERCGDNSVLCCAAGQTCLDGVVCAAACPPEQALCGASLESCCAAAEVCLDDACVRPGVPCADDFDCRDAALYCDPTLGRCLPTPAGVSCEVPPDFARIELRQEWHFAGVEVGGRLYENVIYSPMVGDVSGDGVPDVVVPVYAGTDFRAPVLVALSGDDGRVLVLIDRTGTMDSEGVAIANFDPADAALEIAYRQDGGGLRIVDGDGVTELARRATSDTRGTVEVVDWNHDGVPDVVLGCRVFDGRDLSVLIAAGECPTGGIEAPSVADLDGDGEPEITNGALAIDHDGTTLWSGGFGGLTAVADLNLDGAPEVITIDGGEIRVQAGATGATLIGPGGAWAAGTFAIPGGGNGGAPTVADFDGDGLPELATAGRGAYVVYDPDCLPTPPRAGGEGCGGATGLLRWQTPTQDISSSVTGSSVFDFQGDGVAEVVYNDECFLHVYDGRDGTELLMEPIPNSSRTGYEYPIVVDVDADGNSEIVVVANRDQAVTRDRCPAAYAAALGVPVASLPPEIATGTSGVFVFGDEFDRWVPTRPIWNQYSYHVTNVTASGDVPAREADNWSTPGLNNYRQNVQGGLIANAPDLEVALEAAGRCATSEIRLSAVIRNAGSRGVPPGVEVLFVRTDVAPEVVVAATATASALLPGGSERITVTASEIPTDVDLVFEVRVDGADAATECDESDNTATATDRCPGFG